MAVEDAFLVVMGAMAYPNDAAARAGFVAALQAEAGQYGDQGIGIERERPRPGSFADEMMNRLATRAVGGSIAGETLLLLLSLAEHAPAHCSINKALWLAFHEAAGGRPTVDGTKQVPKTKRSLLAAWKEFQPVCHLWGAYRLMLPTIMQRPQLLVTDEGLKAFLGIAAELRRLVRQYNLPIKAEVLDPYEIPPNQAAVCSLFIPEPSEQVLEILGTYTAEKWKSYV